MTDTGNQFEVLGEDRYRLLVPDCQTTLEVDRLRRERHELRGELCVRCELPGAHTVNGVLAIGEMNLSSVRAREDRARYLVRRARTNGDIDWLGMLEELAQRVLAAERTGTPSVDLRSLPKPDPDDTLDVDGLILPRRHPAFWFGDGGGLKSYLALQYVGRLALAGRRVALFDWELSGEDHRDRLERLFGERMPAIEYARCERPLVSERDRLRRIVRQKRIEFAVFDSCAFACDGPPEAAEVAGRYFRSLRQIGEIGSLHIAHISKAEGGDQKPFGSAFWHNGARSTWFVQRADTAADGRVQIGLYNRKTNLGPLRSPVGFEIAFSQEETRFERVDVAHVPDLAVKLSIRQRMMSALRDGAMSRDQLAEMLDAKPETVKRTANRDKRSFVVLDGGFIGLRESQL